MKVQMREFNYKFLIRNGLTDLIISYFIYNYRYIIHNCLDVEIYKIQESMSK
jgi:hypothetical protein